MVPPIIMVFPRDILDLKLIKELKLVNPKNLYGTKIHSISIECVDAIIRGIGAGDDIPCIFVYEMRSKLDSYWIDHGYHRAVAYYIESAPILAAITGSANFNESRHIVNIGELELIKDPYRYYCMKLFHPYR